MGVPPWMMVRGSARLREYNTQMASVPEKYHCPQPNRQPKIKKKFLKNNMCDCKFSNEKEGKKENVQSGFQENIMMNDFMSGNQTERL